MCSATPALLKLAHKLLVVIHLIASVAQFSIPTKYRAVVTAWSFYGPHRNTSASLVTNSTHIEYTQTVSVLNTEVNPVYFCAAFLLLAALDHLFIVFTFRVYESRVEGGERAITSRWVEYSISASLMNVLIALLSGVQDVMILIVIACLTALMMTAGQMGESSSNSNLYPSFVGWACFMLVWGIIFESFSAFSDKAPAFVWAIVITLFICEMSFGLVPLYSHRGRPQWDREIAYAVLSLVSKQLLAWITFGGLVNRDKSEM